MTTELWLLLLSIAVFALYLGAQSLLFRWHYGVIFAATSRDDPPPQSAVLGRAERALRNFNETYVPFVAMLLVAHLADRNDPAVLWGAALWFVGRLAYLPLYVLGVFALRSLVWCVIGLGLFVMFFGLVF